MVENRKEMGIYGDALALHVLLEECLKPLRHALALPLRLHAAGCGVCWRVSRKSQRSARHKGEGHDGRACHPAGSRPRGEARDACIESLAEPHAGARKRFDKTPRAGEFPCNHSGGSGVLALWDAVYNAPPVPGAEQERLLRSGSGTVARSPRAGGSDLHEAQS